MSAANASTATTEMAEIGRRRRWIAALVLAAASVVSLPAAAAEAECVRDLKGEGRAVEFVGPMDEPRRIGLASSIHYALSDTRDTDWPFEDTAKGSTCVLGEVEAGGVKYPLYGGSDWQPIRWAQAKGGRRIVFLAAAPPVEQAYALYRNPPADGSAQVKEPIFALVLVTAEIRRVVRIYDALPPEAVLKQDMAAALEQRLPLIADYDPKSGAVSFRVKVESGRQAMLWSVPDGKAWAKLTAPDGEHFLAEPTGGVRMAKSRFVCPGTAGPYVLQEFTVIDGRDGETDLFCKFFTANGWISVFVTRYPATFTGAESFAQAVRDAKAANPEKGPAPALLPAGAAEGPEQAATWTDARGMRQGVLQRQVGQWHAKMRATYPAEEQAAMADAAEVIFATVHREMSPDRL